MTDWAKFGRAVGGNPLPQVADGGYTPVEPGLTIGKLNERNAAAYSQDAAATPAAGAAPELKPVGVYRYGYPEGYPTDPSEGLGSNSVVAIRNSNAAEYGHSDSYTTPTNYVGDKKEKDTNPPQSSGGLKPYVPGEMRSGMCRAGKHEKCTAGAMCECPCHGSSK